MPLSTVGGRIVGPQGAPQAGTLIQLRSDSSTSKAISAEDGSWLATVCATDGPFVVSAALQTLEGERVAPAGDQHVDFHVAALGTLRYRAISSGEVAAVSSLRLHRRIDLDRFLLVSTPGGNAPDPHGWCEVELPHGEHELFASNTSGRYCTAARTVRIVQGIASEVVFELEPACTLKFTLAEGESPLPSGYSVSLVSESDVPRLQALKQGRRILWSLGGGANALDYIRSVALSKLPEFEINGLACGPYALVVFPEGVILGPDRIDVSDARQSIALRWRAAD